MSCTKKRQTVEKRYVRGEVFLHELLLNHITLYQKKQKSEKLKSLNELVQPFSRIDTLVLTNHVGKVVKLLFSYIV